MGLWVLSRTVTADRPEELVYGTKWGKGVSFYPVPVEWACVHCCCLWMEHPCATGRWLGIPLPCKHTHVGSALNNGATTGAWGCSSTWQCFCRHSVHSQLVGSPKQHVPLHSPQQCRWPLDWERGVSSHCLYRYETVAICRRTLWHGVLEGCSQTPLDLVLLPGVLVDWCVLDTMNGTICPVLGVCHSALGGGICSHGSQQKSFLDRMAGCPIASVVPP